MSMGIDYDYYSNPYFELTTFYHVLGPFSFVLNSFGLYVVLFKTNKAMGEYRIHLLIHLSIGAIFEFYMCVCCCPKLHTPLYMGSTYGALSGIFGVPTFYQQSICFVLIGFLLASCAHLAYFRANSILMNGTSFKLSHSHFVSLIIILYLLIFIVIVGIQLLIRSEQDGVENARIFLLTNPRFVSLHNPATAKTLYLVDKELPFGSIFLTLVGLFMMAMIIWNGISCSMMVYQISSKVISRQNARKIKRYLFAVQMQISPCIICYLIPCGWLASCLVAGIVIPICQVLNDLSCLMTVVQSPLSMLALFYLNSDYRKWIFTLVRRKNKTHSILVNGAFSTINTRTATSRHE